MSENNTTENPSKEDDDMNVEDSIYTNDSNNKGTEIHDSLSESIDNSIYNMNAESDSETSDRENVEEETVSRFQEYFNETVEGYKPKMTDTLLTFFELREIDEELTDIEDEKGDLPQKIELIKSKISSAEKELALKKSQLEKLNAEKSRIIVEDNSYEEKISKYDEQKYDVRSNKEYDEIVKTIESLFEEVKKNETRLKEVTESILSLETDTEKLNTTHNELSADLAENQTLLDELNEQYMQDESSLREKREALFAKLDTVNSALYERINSSYKGEATAIVRKGNCSGCFNSIPPQKVIEIKSAEKIFTCQSCGRILISEDILTAK
jgi:predicted  nucleic acid-binding Zn-ribbon protein